jgi:translation initiation factor IF-3
LCKAEAPASHLVDAVWLLLGYENDRKWLRVGVCMPARFCFLSFFIGGVIISKEQQQVNEAIRAREVRLIGGNGEQLGIQPLREALRMAQEQNLDLVNVAPQAKPPVCRIMDYGKYRYEQSKREKEARRKQKIVQLKEVRLSPSIEDHDVQTKLKNVVKFLQQGDKVKLSIRFRGREITHQDLGRRVLVRMAQEVKEISEIERQPKLEGRQMIMILTPKSSN